MHVAEGNGMHVCYVEAYGSVMFCCSLKPHHFYANYFEGQPEWGV